MNKIMEQIKNEIVGRLLSQGYNLQTAEVLALEIMEEEEC